MIGTDFRLSEFQKRLETDAAMLENPVDLFYITGLNLSRGVLLVTKEDATLFVDGRYFAKAQKIAPCTVRLLAGNYLIDWLEARPIRTVEFDAEWTAVARHEALKQEAKSVFFKPCLGLLKAQRMIKNGEELISLRRAASVTFAGFKYIESLLKEGVTEEELAMEFEFFVRKAGASALSFSPIIAFGENSAYPHYRAGKSTLTLGQIVLIDVGAIVDDYAGDLTRVIFFGPPDAQLEVMLELTKKAQQKAFEAARPGATFGELDLAARSVYVEAGVEPLFTHSLGHGIGLQTHEYPSIKATGSDRDIKLAAGMVFTIEPGLYRPGLGGVRWEDVVVVTKNGCERLIC
jgi:Xaa-Pro aminopeptidase